MSGLNGTLISLRPLLHFSFVFLSGLEQLLVRLRAALLQAGFDAVGTVADDMGGDGIEQDFAPGVGG